MIARIAEQGFVSPGPVRAQRPDEPYKLRFVDGLDAPVQYFVIGVGEHEIVVALTGHGEQVRRAFGTQPIVTRIEDRAGWARVAADPGITPEHAAVAVAALKAIGGWDESSPIVVEVGATTLRVFLEFTELQWHARVEA